MACFGHLISILVVCIMMCPLYKVEAHPLCTDFTPPYRKRDGNAVTLQFCTDINDSPDGSCCTPETELLRKVRFDADIAASKGAVSPACQVLHKKIACGICEPWSAHLFSELSKTAGLEDSMMLCDDFCTEYTAACGLALNLPKNFCAIRTRTPNPYYCYPFVKATVSVTDPTKAVKPAYPYLQGKYPDSMTGLVMRPDLPAWWIVDQQGLLYEFEARYGVKELVPILNMQDKLLFGGEMGLLGLAFHPNFGSNRRFYLNYITLDQHTNVAQFTWVPGDLAATRSSEITMFKWYQPETNHNGGWIGFSASDYADPFAAQHYLFVATGDGGGANDMHWPQDKGELGNAQDLTVPYGKMLRVSIPANDALLSPGQLYLIPDDNPFASSAGPEMKAIYAYGLRNPWRCSFDRLTDDLWCADVGQLRVEEFNVIVNGGNYGWRMFEGTRCNTDTGFPNNCTLDFIEPAWQYCSEDFSLQPDVNEVRISKRICNGSDIMGQSLTGGFVYRGKRYAKELGGQYVFADFETNVMGRLQKNPKTKLWEGYKMGDGTNGITYTSTFAEHFNTGELFMVSYSPPGIYTLYVGNLLNSTAAVVGADSSNTVSLANLGT